MADEIKETVDNETEGSTTEETKSKESEQGTDGSEGTKEASEEPEEKESLEDKEARLSRQLKQIRKKMGKEEGPAPKSKKQSDEFDEAQLAYLAVKGIESDEDIDFAKDMQKRTGLPLRELVKDDYFTTKLNARKEARTIAEATPSNSKRGTGRTNDPFDVEYANYQKTGKLPTDRKMAERVIEKRLKIETDSENHFTSNPVVGSY